MRERAHILALALALGLILASGPGCFVLDELDSGLAEMKAVSPNGKNGKNAEKPEPAPRPGGARESSGPKVDLSGWWKTARTPSSGPKDPETATEVVSCRIGGGIRFMSKTDCQVQGGRF